MLPRTIAATALATLALAAPAAAAGPSTYAVIGDTPYGDAQVADFPALVADVNADPKVRRVLHLGDIKNGSSTCTTERFLALRDLYDTFEDPFVYTPGDNEWTDCHRPAAGGFLPLERLAVLRELFFADMPRQVVSQGGEFVENARFHASDVTFATVHVVGSDNDLQPWFGAAETPELRAQRLAEFERRQAANLEWLDAAYAAARKRGDRGVVIAMQADTVVSGTGFEAINARLKQLAADFPGRTLLLQGDTHVYKTDQPFPAAPRLTRVVVEGETAGEWLRLAVDPRDPEVFSWSRETVSP